jgi:hypothetical protein
VGRRAWKYLFGLCAIGALALPGAGVASKPTANAINSAVDIIHIGADLNNGEALPLIGGSASGALESRRQIASHTPVIGEVRNWVGLDDQFGALYRKGYTFRGMGEHVEIWVASERRTLFGFTATGTAATAFGRRSPTPR